MTYNIFTIGCQMNKSDSERLSSYLSDLGFKKEEDIFKSDLVFFVTCGVRQSAEDRIHGLINTILKKNKKSFIVVTGCISKREDLQKSLGKRVKLWFDISDLNNLDVYLSEHFSQIEKNKKRKKDYLKIKPEYSSSFSAFVPIGNGCNNFCSYCVVPYARGREVYRPASDIISEVKDLISRGYKEINLIAQNVNSYSSKNSSTLVKSFGFRSNKKNIDFADLLKAVDDIEGDFWLRFSSSHPKDVSDNLIKVLKNSKHVCEHFHLAIQSGDDDILEAMNRKYKADDYVEKVEKIRAALDYKNGLPASITSDVIVGFPGEKKKHFNNTKKLVKNLNFDLIFISRYSPRKGTASFDFEDDVSTDEKARRERELEDILRRSALKNNKKYIGKEVEVLIDGFDRKGNLVGRTRTWKLVRIKDKEVCNRSLIGNFVKLRIKEVYEFEMEGELIEKKGGKVVVILGPTASGKTALAVKLADKYNGEIISADSRQVYKGMDIGTGKDLAEYYIGKKKIEHHLIDVADPKDIFSLADFQKMAYSAIDDILSRGKLAFLVGGSGLYLEAVVDNYLLAESKPSFVKRDEYEALSLEELHKRIKKINKDFFGNINNSDLNNKRRLARYLEVLEGDSSFKAKKGEPLYDFLILGLNPEREIIKEKIHRRLLVRLNEEGMIDEVKGLLKEGISHQRLESFGLEYKYISMYLQKKISEKQLVDHLFRAICKFAKKQMSWFRRWEKMGTDISWIDNNVDEAKKKIDRFILNK
jgi:tRNA-2-methylthio-N6-dimethylallyladenosine synthase